MLRGAQEPPTKTELMKWCFLAKQETMLGKRETFYDFFPYKYGPFSFTLANDIVDLQRNGYLDVDSLSIKKGMSRAANKAVSEIGTDCEIAVQVILDRYESQSRKQLLGHVYKQYPWYSINSELVNDAQRNLKADTAVYTIGYEGLSIDSFLFKLLRSGLERIIDVRKNPISRKFGFSKNRLNDICKAAGITYSHYPQLGVPSELRANLASWNDYQRVFVSYRLKVIPTATAHIDAISEQIVEQPSVLLCMEKNHNYCHRHIIAESIREKTGLEIINM